MRRSEVDMPGRLRPEIALSWQRMQLFGLHPDLALDVDGEVEVDVGSQLQIAAAPVLSSLETRLTGTGFTLLLADRDCRIVHRWCEDRRARGLLDDLGARTGVIFREDTIGTNALGTAFELRKGVTVNGGEHFAEPLKRFSCYGQPIRHPLTRRIEGILDITSLGASANPLLAPLIARAVEEIEQRLVDAARSSERSLLAAFQAASNQRSRPVTAISEDSVFCNKAALDLLEPSDYALLRVLVQDQPAGLRPHSTSVSLTNGEVVLVEATRVAGAGCGTLFHIDRQAEPAASYAAPLTLTRVKAPATDAPRLICGPTGTGRTTTARELGGPSAVFLSDTLALIEGDRLWARRFTDLMVGTRVVCVEGIDGLSDQLLHLIVDAVNLPGRPALIFTAAAFEELTGRARALASLCPDRISLLPLSQRITTIGELAAGMLAALSPGAKVRLAPSALEALAAQSWPGNLHELHTVLTQAMGQRSMGDITTADLPADYRAITPERHLAGRERAERAAIVHALRAAEGNKVRAALELGVSRTTLYARMKALRIVTY